jgi:serine/threonine protein kinase
LLEHELAFIFQQVLMGLNYMHKKNIIHRDIKLENIVMQTNRKDDLTIKITDFGFAKIFDPAVGLKDILGSPIYMAPEIVQRKTYGVEVDIWAAGVLLYIMVVGAPPFVTYDKKELFEQIKS